MWQKQESSGLCEYTVYIVLIARTIFVYRVQKHFIVKTQLAIGIRAQYFAWYV